MKRLSLILIILLLNIPAFSQDDSKGGGGVGLGIKGGLNFAGFTEVSGFSLESRTGVMFGAYAPIWFNGKWGIQPEFMFSSQGSKIDTDVHKYNYINIPLMLNIRFLKFIKLQAGPQIGFLQSADIEGDNVEEFLNSTDMSLAFGAEVLLPVGLLAGARYNIGLTDINDGLPDFDDDINSRMLQLYIGLKILGKR